MSISAFPDMLTWHFLSCFLKTFVFSIINKQRFDYRSRNTWNSYTSVLLNLSSPQDVIELENWILGSKAALKCSPTTSSVRFLPSYFRDKNEPIRIGARELQSNPISFRKFDFQKMFALLRCKIFLEMWMRYVSTAVFSCLFQQSKAFQGAFTFHSQKFKAIYVMQTTLNLRCIQTNSIQLLFSFQKIFSSIRMSCKMGFFRLVFV